MGELFGCEVVRRDLHLLAGVVPDAIPTAFPAMAHHLSWCASCRGELRDLLEFAAAAAAAGEAPAAAASAPAHWHPAPADHGATVRELAADFVASVAHGIASFLAVPGQVTVFAATASDGARRGAATGSVGLGQQLLCPLEGSGLNAHLALGAFGDEAMRLEVSLSGAIVGAMSAQISLCDHGDVTLLGAEPLGSNRTATFRGIPPGRYIVDIHEQAQQRRFRLRFVVQAPS